VISCCFGEWLLLLVLVKQGDVVSVLMANATVAVVSFVVLIFDIDASY